MMKFHMRAACRAAAGAQQAQEVLRHVANQQTGGSGGAAGPNSQQQRQQQQGAMDSAGSPGPDGASAGGASAAGGGSDAGAAGQEDGTPGGGAATGGGAEAGADGAGSGDGAGDGAGQPGWMARGRSLLSTVYREVAEAISPSPGAPLDPVKVLATLRRGGVYLKAMCSCHLLIRDDRATAQCGSVELALRSRLPSGSQQWHVVEEPHGSRCGLLGLMLSVRSGHDLLQHGSQTPRQQPRDFCEDGSDCAILGCRHRDDIGDKAESGGAAAAGARGRRPRAAARRGAAREVSSTIEHSHNARHPLQCNCCR